MQFPRHCLELKLECEVPALLTNCSEMRVGVRTILYSLGKVNKAANMIRKARKRSSKNSSPVKLLPLIR